ncbi:uncharacterized protein LOC102720620 [Oryza brachyantha]|uniref:uncharacterized protein LOC102720620 n=1 Tax=Oryza brachyantha TaxID=4533 RepID=UPI000776074D|nr:uncharacterized protein LOC102720620 [Oryza brachyantha]
MVAWQPNAKFHLYPCTIVKGRFSPHRIFISLLACLSSSSLHLPVALISSAVVERCHRCENEWYRVWIEGFMAPPECPPWLDPHTAFRINVRISPYTAKLDDGSNLAMDGQEDNWWVNGVVSMDRLVEDLKSQTIWGSQQKPIFYGTDHRTSCTIAISSNLVLMSQFSERFDSKVLSLSVKIVDKASSSLDDAPVNTAIIHVDGGSIVQDTPDCAEFVATSPGAGPCGADPSIAAIPKGIPIGDINWDELSIQPLTIEGGTCHVAFNEDEMFELLGLGACDGGVEATATEATSNQHLVDLEKEMNDAAIPVSDDVEVEPNRDWDRDDPDMSVDTIYPNMPEFRMAIRQYAINEEFELGIEKSDPTRFRGFCCANGCPWGIVAKTQHDKTVRV